MAFRLLLSTSNYSISLSRAITITCVLLLKSWTQATVVYREAQKSRVELGLQVLATQNDEEWQRTHRC